MKLFKVRIDNDPGGWKSGEDHSELVIANSREDAIQLVKDGWGSKYENGKYVYGIGDSFRKAYMSRGCNISATEIRFDRRQVNLNTLLD